VTQPEHQSRLDAWAEKRGFVRREHDGIGAGEILGELRRPPIVFYAIASFVVVVLGMTYFAVIGAVVGFACWGACCGVAARRVTARREEAARSTRPNIARFAEDEK
jgi:hypothetical protein